MKKIIFPAVLFIFLLSPAVKVHSQSLSTTEPTQVTFDTTGLPGWVKDLRRAEIIAFGTFPFTLFFVTFAADMIRWNNENGMDFSSEGRRYAPWPMKSAGGIELTSQEFLTSIAIAAGLSVSLALIDYFIRSAKRSNEMKRIESAPSDSVTIERNKPDNDYPEENPDIDSD